MKLTDEQLDEIEATADERTHDSRRLGEFDRLAEDALALIAEVKAQRATIERVRAMHQPVQPLDEDDGTCEPNPCTCGQWDATQCPDRRALDED